MLTEKKLLALESIVLKYKRVHICTLLFTTMSIIPFLNNATLFNFLLK